MISPNKITAHLACLFLGIPALLASEEISTAAEQAHIKKIEAIAALETKLRSEKPNKELESKIKNARNQLAEMRSKLSKEQLDTLIITLEKSQQKRRAESKKITQRLIEETEKADSIDESFVAKANKLEKEQIGLETIVRELNREVRRLRLK